MQTLGDLIDRLTIANIRLWHLEDIKHDENASDSEVANAARKISVVNKERNMLIDEINQYMKDCMSGKIKHFGFPKNKLY